MRERNLLSVFLVLNALLATALMAYLFLALSREPSAVAGSPAGALPQTHLPAKPAEQVAATLLSAPGRNSPPAPDSAASEFRPTASSPGVHRPCTWEDLGSAEYPAYLERLRQAGCPEARVRSLIVVDVNERLAQKKLKLAVQLDCEWWRVPSDPAMATLYQEKGLELEKERQEFLGQLLGPKRADPEIGESLEWNGVPLTGPVLGRLSPSAHNAVQEIVTRSPEHYDGGNWGRVNGGKAQDPVELARWREQTRTDLARVLNAEQVEEFFLRYSHNAEELRDELRGFQPTPDEFRKIFRAVDPINHQMQLESGTSATLSPKQKERLEKQREGAIQEVLSPQRYQEYLVVKDPVYRRAQITAEQYRAPATAIMPIYHMTKASEDRRLHIINDASLTPPQRSEALNAVNQDQQRSLQQILTAAAARR